MKNPHLNVVNENESEITYQSDLLPDVRMEQIYKMTVELQLIASTLKLCTICAVLGSLLVFSFLFHQMPNIKEVEATVEKIANSMGKGEHIARMNTLQDAIEDTNHRVKYMIEVQPSDRGAQPFIVPAQQFRKWPSTNSQQD